MDLADATTYCDSSDSTGDGSFSSNSAAAKSATFSAIVFFSLAAIKNLLDNSFLGCPSGPRFYLFDLANQLSLVLALINNLNTHRSKFYKPRKCVTACQ